MKNLLYFSAILIALNVLFTTACKKDEDQEPEKLKGWIAGETYEGWGVILYTEDGGTNWVRQGNKQSFGEGNLEFVSAIDENLVWACGDTSNGTTGVLKTIDGGQNWVRIDAGSGLPLISCGGIGGVGDLVWAVGGEGMIAHSDDGGISWERQDEGKKNGPQYGGITVVDWDHIWAVGDDGTGMVPYINHTSDGGLSWERQGVGAFNEDVTAFIDVHAISKDYCWVVGTASSAYATEDGGKTWKQMMPPLGLAHNNGVCIVDKDYTWVATDYSIANFYNGPGNSWTSFHLPTATEAIWPVTIGVTLLDKNTVWLATTAGGTQVKGQVFHTTDGGQNWILQEIPVISSFRRISFPKGNR